MLIGCSEPEREEMPNLRVELRRVLALNLLGPVPGSSLMESSNLLWLPNILFLY